jgi:hypothetical protein
MGGEVLESNGFGMLGRSVADRSARNRSGVRQNRLETSGGPGEQPQWANTPLAPRLQRSNALSVPSGVGQLLSTHPSNLCAYCALALALAFTFCPFCCVGSGGSSPALSSRVTSDGPTNTSVPT